MGPNAQAYVGRMRLSEAVGTAKKLSKENARLTRALELIAEPECDHDPEMRCAHCIAKACLAGFPFGNAARPVSPPYHHPADEHFVSLVDFLRHLVDRHGIEETPELWSSGRIQFDGLHEEAHRE